MVLLGTLLRIPILDITGVLQPSSTIFVIHQHYMALLGSKN